MYYSGWYVPFPVGFANTAANHGAVPLVQMDPEWHQDRPGSLPDGTTVTSAPTQRLSAPIGIRSY